MYEEVFVEAAESGDEVIFECVDGLFGGVAAVDMGGMSWKSTASSCMKSFKIWEHSLSRRCNFGRNPALHNRAWTVL